MYNENKYELIIYKMKYIDNLHLNKSLNDLILKSLIEDTVFAVLHSALGFWTIWLLICPSFDKLLSNRGKLDGFRAGRDADWFT